MEATLGNAQEAGEGQIEQCQGQGGGCLAFHWERANLSWEQLEVGENHLLPALLPGPRFGEGARANAAKVSGRDFKVPLQCRLLLLCDLLPTERALADSPVPLGKSMALENAGD